MRALLLATAIVLLALSPILAQTFEGGFIVGVAATQVDGDGYGGFDKAGPVGGIWVERLTPKKLYLRSEIRYIQKGSYAKNEVDGITTNFYRMRLHYIEVPVLLGYRFANGASPFLGLSGGYLAKVREENEVGEFPVEDTRQFRKAELAFVAGIDYKYNQRWVIGAMFSYSATPIRPHTGNITYRLNQGQYNQVLQLVVRYKL